MDDENKLPKQDASKVKEGFRWLAKIAAGATTRHQVKAAILENSIPADRSETPPAIEIRRLCALIREEKNEIQQEHLFLEAREHAVYLREWNSLVNNWKFKKGRKKGAVSPATAYIINFVSEDPDLSADEIADSIIDDAGKGESPFYPDGIAGKVIYEKGKGGEITKEALIKKICNVKSRHLKKQEI